jgi:colanic acid/amylovoran biosynthesis protein
MKQRLRILIPNATSPQNIGDAAILEGLLALIRQTYPDASIVMHSSEPNRHQVKVQRVRQTLYSWAVFAKPVWWQRLWRVSCLGVATLVYKGKQESWFPLPGELRRLIQDYRQADLIVYVGGGALRSQSGLSQTLNLLMTTLLFWWGSQAEAASLVAPISFGPFASPWQEKIVASVLKKMDFVSVREAISFQKLQSYLPNVVLSQDHGLLVPTPKVISPKKTARLGTVVVGFTIRKWLTRHKQQDFEDAFLQALIKFGRHHPEVIFQPVVQVSAPEYGDYDLQITQKIAQGLKNVSLPVRPVIQNQNVAHAQSTYAQLTFLLGMRMHSNILAATVGVPFVALSYEHKTEGIAQALGLGKYCLRVDSANAPKILTLLNTAWQEHTQMKSTMSKKLEKITREERQRWQEIFLKYV